MMRNSIFPAILTASSLLVLPGFLKAEPPQPFGPEYPQLDKMATGEWQKDPRNRTEEQAKAAAEKAKAKGKGKGKGRQPKRIINLNVPREDVVAFAVYTQDIGTVKMTAQLYPLLEGEPREVRLELKDGNNWKEIAKEEIVYPGWTAHFRLENWDGSKDVPYRVRHGDKANFEGTIRKDPVDKDVIVVGNLSCNSSRTPGPRPNIVKNLLHHDPDVLFFAGDQTYHHTEHTAGWIQFGLQFREVMKDRPTITIPDDHDVGQGNLWGEGGVKAETRVGHDGGYIYHPEYVNMVERQQTWHLPDAYDPTPIAQNIGVYYTRLRVGGIDFAILEDRKFKSGPDGKIPKMGPRPDHINDPKYDRSAVDLPNLKLLGDRQLKFLHEWGQDWTGAEMKCVLSQTAFCGAVHKHGNFENRLLADLDSNAWPQTGRNKALTEIRRAWAPHLCGDQHLAVVVKHGIENHGDGPMGFTSPAIINTIYGRWWHPEDEKAGANPVPDSPLPWTGEYLDGLGNKINMIAYANPEDRSDEKKRADGYGIARFNKKTREITFENWDRFADASTGKGQFPGWPLTFKMEDNDGRKATHWLPKITFSEPSQVVQVVKQDSEEILYTVRIQGDTFQPKVFAGGDYLVKYGKDKPDGKVVRLKANADKAAAGKATAGLQ
ncbi:MAG: hypothetical protein HKN23_06970 [Verrucomicrobiales bacterium]|nr:hypothetical protein [Verrucomicrobiales bacterium]